MNEHGRLPEFIVVGSAKCGTSSLHYYLDQHPEVHVSRPKELNFFVGDQSPAAQWTNWHRGVD